MSRKNSNLKQILSAKSLTTSFVSPVTVIRLLDDVSYQINVTTSNSAGTFTVQVSNDYVVEEVTGNVRTAGTWCDLNLSGIPTVASANDIITIALNGLPYNAVRLSYTATTPGTGTCNATILARQAGG